MSRLKTWLMSTILQTLLRIKNDRNERYLEEDGREEEGLKRNEWNEAAINLEHGDNEVTKGN